MSAVEGFRSPHDKSAGGLDGQLCGFLNIKFEEVEKRVHAGGTDEEIVDWVFAHGLLPNRTQALVWNEYSRKPGWNDRLTGFLAKMKIPCGFAQRDDLVTTFALIDANEARDSGSSN